MANQPQPASAPGDTRLPEAPVLALAGGRALWCEPGGKPQSLGLAEAAKRAQGEPPIVCHARSLARRLAVPPFRAYDLLELFAFVRPAAFVVPTPRGLAEALALPQGADPAEQLAAAARALLRDLSRQAVDRPNAERLAGALAGADWPWSAAVCGALAGETRDGASLAGLDIWNRLPKWEEPAPEPPPEDHPIAPVEAAGRLAQLLGPGAEERLPQIDYAKAVTEAFRPRDRAGEPRLVLAEAGTGVGKTVGYLASASLWAERNGGTVWLSTYTKNLQRQLDRELDRLYPEPAEKHRRAVLRKGRENYLCLLNFEDAARAAALSRPGDLVALALLARWAMASRDGDMVGGDFPAWAIDLLGRGRTLDLADQRGECIYSACPHYRRCFIEAAIRRSRGADLVIANHALTLINAAQDGEGGRLPLRYVFDEGHHLFDAADSAFSAQLSGREAAELRRWLAGHDGGRRVGRALGLERRYGDLTAGLAEAEAALRQVLQAARALPAEGWLGRLENDQPSGPTESFLARVRQQVLARGAEQRAAEQSLEAATAEPVPGLLAAAEALDAALADLEVPLQRLSAALAGRLDDEAASLDSGERNRLEAACRSLRRRAVGPLGAWRAMLAALSAGTPEEFVDWFAIDLRERHANDIGMHRHFVDPTRPFAVALLARAHGAVITSATLRDRPPEAPDDWQGAEMRTGAQHLALPAKRVSLPSPFDHAAHARVFVVTDVARDMPEQVAAAFRELFLAAGGGALGLFTAIERLRRVHARIQAPLEAAGLTLLAQHVDAMDVGTLIDIFRAETDACLLGTDAVRDGVDVPGRALRLIVFDRVPWPRPDLLHRARRGAFGGRAYDDLLVRLRLKQAYGRLLRRADDRGVFVILDAMLPSRLLTAFPPEVAVARLGLKQTVEATAEFLARS
ncbi:MAG: ATP-dependent DNA helicase [Alphaproteobacteria bacterium]|nr:ATP-dependent DNA helicase [Alphaproteobacteria bacterium]